MAWKEIVDSELGVVIIRAEDCLHCVELRAILSERPLSCSIVWIDKKNAHDLYAEFPLFAASVDILPFAGIFSDGKLNMWYVRRLENGLKMSSRLENSAMPSLVLK